MGRTMLAGTAVAVGLIGGFSGADDDGWIRYHAESYGFSMLVAEGSQMEEREWPEGWGGLYATYEGVQLWGLARLGAPPSAEEIEAFGKELTGTVDSNWELLDEGEESEGWTWYRTVRAASGDDLVFGGYGVGRRGAYLLLLRTTRSDYELHQADYHTWYESVRLD